ncbi:hypothetical protein HPB50_009145 [Hyalomma asiaticum]|uniref:Uncharacterized protein n=1 Tax=Hyalomma asiaticum TaxID=266040 RepID=A0ACB7SUY0_HYAAI|nr:hypothetical protein HPB50_009145 [Hyalomma asiaticum]
MANASTGANPIWNFFVKVPPGQEAQCLKCHSILKTPTGTTTLATHLKRHPDVFVTYEKERCARKSVKSTAKPDVQQPSVADRFKPKLKHTAPKAQQMTKAIAGFIVHGMHSYSVVEEPGFVAVMNAAMPEYVVPSWTTFSRAIIPELYASKKQNLMNSLQAVIDGGVEAISITTDSWTSRANESYLSGVKDMWPPLCPDLQEATGCSVASMDINLARHARCDSRGHSANYGIYVVLGAQIQRILHCEHRSSQTREIRHPGVRSYFRKKWPDIHHYFHVWHTANESLVWTGLERGHAARAPVDLALLSPRSVVILPPPRADVSCSCSDEYARSRARP